MSFATAPREQTTTRFESYPGPRTRPRYRLTPAMSPQSLQFSDPGFSTGRPTVFSVL